MGRWENRQTISNHISSTRETQIECLERNVGVAGGEEGDIWGVVWVWIRIWIEVGRG